MEVPGQRVSTLESAQVILCNPCEDDGKQTHADGFCKECEEYMCTTCFDKHKRRKISKHHTLTDCREAYTSEKENDELEKCHTHLQETKKFYCQQHEKTGCGDCMIHDHKTCKVEYIRDRARTFKDSQEFKELTEGAKICHHDLKEMLTSIKGYKKQISDDNQKFVHDVNIFREEIIAYVNKLTNAMLKQGADMMGTDMTKIGELEKEGESLMTELSLLTKEVESHIDKPNKLFVNSIAQKPMLLRLKDELDSIRGKNRIDSYEFRRDENIERLSKECKQLGRLQKIKKDIEKVRQTEQAVQAEAKPIPQPLLERQLICRNMTVDGEYLRTQTYSAKSRERERQLAEAEVRTKLFDERRKQDEVDLERRIRQQMHIHKREPAVVEDLPVSDLSEEEDEVEIVEEEDGLPELTSEMENVINNALSRGNPGQVLVDKFKIQITKGDIATLAGLSWLNDEVINFYMNLLMERGEKDGNSKVYAFNTFFYPKVMSGGQAAVRRWTRRVDVLAVDYILIPVHLGMHWCLAVINFKQKDIQYFDSMGGNNTQCLNALKQYLCDESLDKKKTEFNLNGWKSTIVKDIPQQMNGSDCGMFACKYAEYITREANITFTQGDMPYFRRRMVYEIVSAKLLQ